MCGRYFLKLSAERLQQLFATENIAAFSQTETITPLQTAPIIVHRRMGLARWGLLPDYAEGDDKGLCAKLKNARSETVAEKITFSALWSRGRRCLIPAEGFFEWPEEKIKGHPPFKIYVPGAESIAFAGLWNKRGDLVTYTILTRSASEELGKIHSRMPVAFPIESAASWFNASPDAAATMIQQESITNWTAALQGRIEPKAPSLFDA